MAVELLVADDESEVQTAAREAGFEQTGGGPNFDGEPTTRYRIESP
jgi:hypothetical protein